MYCTKLKCRSIAANNFLISSSGYRRLTIEATPLFHWNSKITRLFRNRDVVGAQKVFDEMPHKNVVTWNCLISGYVRNGMIREARQVFDSMPAKNVVSWTAMVTGYSKNGHWGEAKRLFDSIENKNVACWNSMVSGYLSNGRIEEARSLFNAMPVKNEVSWSIMIEGCLRYGAMDEAEALFDESCRSLMVCNVMLGGYGDAMDIRKAYALFTRMNRRDIASWTCMVKCFVKCGEVGKGRKLFDEMPLKDTISWTVMINGYLECGEIDLAKELFDKMPNKDVVVWNSMLHGLVHRGKVEGAVEFFEGMPQRNTVSWNLMLLGYLQQDVTIARKFFDRMPRKDKISWNTLISGYQTEEALVFYVQMLWNGFRPDQGTLSTVISICGILAVQSWGKAMHVSVVKTGYENDGTVMSSLISMYSKCGFMYDASLIFKVMPKHDTVAWNAMIAAHAHHSSAEEAQGVFHSMICAGCKPNDATFLVLLTAFAHSGRVNNGWEYLKLMKRWNLFPKPEHIASLVDLHARLGLLDEALELVNKLPPNLPVYAWESLLSGCSIHGKFKFNNLVVEKIVENRSLDVGMTILQSNLYSSCGMWKNAAQIRAKLKQNQLRKEAGCSWIDVNGSVSCFSYNDKSHIQRKDIYEQLERLSELIEEFGME